MKRHTMRRTLTLAVAVLSVILAINISGFALLITVPAARYRHNINLGHYYLVQLDYDGALRAYSNAIDIDPKKSDAYQGRADTYMKMGNIELAYQDYQKVEDITGEAGLAERMTGLNDKKQEEPPSESEVQHEDSGAVSIVPEETPEPSPIPTLPAPASTDYDSFLQAVKDNPYTYYIQGDYAEPLNTYSTPAVEYAIGDLDNDAVNEVFLSYTNSGGPYNVINTEVWKWNVNSSAFELYAADGGSAPTKDFYSTGYIRVYPKNPKTMLNPFSVYGYNPETKSYDREIFVVKGVTPNTIPNYGVYSAEEDLDHDGIIYYKDNEIAMTQAEYDALIDPYVPDRAHVNLNWQLLTKI